MKYISRTTLGMFMFFGIFLSSITTMQAENPTGTSVFYNVSLTTAKALAAEEGKLVFVEFYADWCVPCKWMEETSFSDIQVRDQLKDGYIAVRVDIDDFDGYALKEHYAIQTLPTILILDHSGRTLERREQSMSAAMLMDLLRNRNRTESTVPVNSSPAQYVQNNQPGKKVVPDEIEKNTNQTKQAIVKTTSYRVQVGVFTDYANTKKLVDQLRDYTNEPVVVLNDYLHDKTVFKVLVGDFGTRPEADRLKNQLWQNYGIDGYVK